MPRYSNNELTLLSRVIFERALKDVNACLAPERVLSESEDVSFASFRRYIAEHHFRIQKGQSVERLSMLLYKKAVDDIAFQADIFGMLLIEIPVRNQRASCEYAVKYISNSLTSSADRQQDVS